MVYRAFMYFCKKGENDQIYAQILTSLGYMMDTFSSPFQGEVLIEKEMQTEQMVNCVFSWFYTSWSSKAVSFQCILDLIPKDTHVE